MRILRGCDNLTEIKNPVVTIGSFDGVHHGHRLLIDRVRDIAKERQAESVVVTFDPHPRQLLKGENRLLSTLGEKLALLAETGIDNVIVVDFTLEFSKINHTQFIEDYIVGKLHTKTLITGHEHNFGHNREGSIGSLNPYGIETIRLERYDNISSTQIRMAIEHGKMQKAAELLGRSGYLVQTPLTENSKLLPPEGEYRVEINGEISNLYLSKQQMPEIELNITILREI